MKTKQKYYHLIKPIIFVLFLSFSMASCEKEDIIPESPDIEDTENPTDTDPNEIVPPIYNPQIQISAESETKRSIFREKDKTKRSKKESAQHSKSRNKSFVMTSVSAL